MKHPINYYIKHSFIEKKEIILKNDSDYEKLCRVVVNQRLFKIVYLDPKSEEIIDYPDETVQAIEISELK